MCHSSINTKEKGFILVRRNQRRIIVFEFVSKDIFREEKDMTEPMLIQLEEAGNKIPGLLKRFAGNEAICVKLVKKFPGDENYANYLEEIKVQNYRDAEQSVHTLKGVASNLGLTKIADITQLIVDEIRGECDYKKIEGWNKELIQFYDETVDIINKNL